MDFFVNFTLALVVIAFPVVLNAVTVGIHLFAGGSQRYSFPCTRYRFPKVRLGFWLDFFKIFMIRPLSIIFGKPRCIRKFMHQAPRLVAPKSTMVTGMVTMSSLF